MTRFEALDNAQISPLEYQAPAGAEPVEAFKLTRGHWALLALVILSVLFIIFITVARSVQIKATTINLAQPDEVVAQVADIRIASLIKLPIGNRVLLLPGEHHVTASAPGFEVFTKALQVEGERNQQFEILMTPLPGKLDIQLSPSVAAKVMIAGQEIAQLPGIIEGVPAGKQELTIDAPLYRPYTTELIVLGKEQTQSIEVQLQAAWAQVSISSVPIGAEVVLDELVVGQTPLSIKIEEGVHSLTLQAEKFKSHTQDVTIVAQQNQQLPEVVLLAADGLLEVNTTPSAAAIILNGDFKGISPMTLALAPDQPQQLQVYKAGYRLLDENITLSPAQSELKQVALQQDLVEVQVSVTPKDALVYVDGVSRGAGSQTLLLNTLPHRVSVRKQGYVSSQNQIIPTKGNRQHLKISLMTKEQHFWSSIPDEYVTKAGQPMLLFKSPGKVKLGSSRRETGRRSNEISYTATLKKHFYVSQYEVTNKQYRQFDRSFSAGNYKKKSLDSNKHPVVNISWQNAAQYCNWLSEKEGLDAFYATKSGYVSGVNANANGYRLPTEVEWAWLARNKNGEVLNYSWGNNETLPSKPVGNFADSRSSDILAFTIGGYDDGYKATSPVGRYQANHRGIYDLDGNAAEWIHDWYSAKGNLDAGDKANLVDPLGPVIGEFHVVRGASWARGHLPQLRLAYRDFGATPKHDIGFRIARYVVPPK